MKKILFVYLLVSGAAGAAFYGIGYFLQGFRSAVSVFGSGVPEPASWINSTGSTLQSIGQVLIALSAIMLVVLLFMYVKLRLDKSRKKH